MFKNTEVMHPKLLYLLVNLGEYIQQTKMESNAEILIRFKVRNYTMDDVLRIAMIMAGCDADEVGLSKSDKRFLRLWWD